MRRFVRICRHRLFARHPPANTYHWCCSHEPWRKCHPGHRRRCAGLCRLCAGSRRDRRCRPQVRPGRARRRDRDRARGRGRGARADAAGLGAAAGPARGRRRVTRWLRAGRARGGRERMRADPRRRCARGQEGDRRCHQARQKTAARFERSARRRHRGASSTSSERRPREAADHVPSPSTAADDVADISAPRLRGVAFVFFFCRCPRAPRRGRIGDTLPNGS